MDKVTLRRLVEDRITNLSGNVFQDFCDRLCLKLHPNDYTPVRAGGSKGDMKNDGYCPKVRLFYAAHATRGESISKTKRKIKSDLEGCIKKQSSVKKWIYLTNDTFPGEVEKFVDELRKEHPNVEIETWGHKKITEKVLEFDDSSISEITEIAMDLFHGLNIETEINSAADILRNREAKQALRIFERLWQGHNEKMTPREKYRTKANIGHAYEQLGKYEKAAEYWLDAKQYDPTYEKARAREALAQIFLGNRAKAYELAKDLLSEFPEEKLGRSVLIRCTPEEINFEEVEKNVPEHQRADAEVAMALAERAASGGLYEIAEEYIVSVIDESKDSPGVTEKLGDLMVTRANLQEQVVYLRGSSAVERTCLENALKLFSDSLKEWEKREVNEHIIRVRLKRSNVNFALENKEGHKKDIEFSFELDPNDKCAIYQYAILKLDEGDCGKGIELLRSIQGQETRPSVEHVLCQRLYERDSSGDKQEALELLKSRIKDLSNEEADFRTEYLALCLTIIREFSGKKEALNYLATISDDIISPEIRCILEAEIYMQEGDSVAAMETAKNGLVIISNSTTREDKRRMAFLLQRLGMSKQALELWKDIVIPEYIGRDTYCLIECAQKCEDALFVIDFSKQLRGNDLWDQRIFELELYYYELFNDDKDAIKVLLDFLGNPADESYVPFAKTRLSVLGIHTGQSDLIESEVKELPSVENIDPHIGRIVVHILRHGTEPINAVKYAYDLLKLNWDHSEAHMAMMEVMFPIGPKIEIEESDLVTEGVAVLYQEDDTKKNKWYIIEDSIVNPPDINRNEFLPSHPISIAMINKKCGESFDLRKDSVQERTATIKSIVSKFIFRYNYCMENFEELFPNENKIQKIVMQQENGKLDLSVMKKIVAQNIEHSNKLMSLYESEIVPLFCIARMMKRSILETISYIAGTPDIKLKCCSGSDEELEIATNVIEKAKAVVLDFSAIMTLRFTQTYQVLKELPIKMIISKGTVEELKNAEVLTLSSEEDIISYTAEGLIKTSAEDIEKQKNSIEELLNFIEANCIIESGLILSQLEKKRRDTLLELFGRPGVESMMLASESGRVLWTDDLATSLFAKTEFGCGRVWTQFMFEYFKDKEVVPSEVETELAVQLMGMEYYYTKPNVDIIMKAVEKGNWDTENYPLKQVLNWFGDEKVKLEGLFYIGGRVIKEVWQKSNLDERAQAITIRILENLSKRSGGNEVINGLYHSIDRIFGVDVLTGKKVKEVIRGWGAGGGSTHIIIP